MLLATLAPALLLALAVPAGRLLDPLFGPVLPGRCVLSGLVAGADPPAA